MKKNIVIVGAGYAGVLTAKKLAKNFKKNDDVNITIIDKNPFHTMLTELHEVAANRVHEESIRMDLNKIFAGRKVNVVIDEITSVDYEKKVVSGKHSAYEYDIIVIATGSKPTFFGVQGAQEHAYTLWSYDDAIRLKDRIRDVFRTASGIQDDIDRKRLLTFHVVGAGFTGVEMIGELAEFVPYISAEYGIDPKDVTMVNVDGLDRAVPILPEKLSAKVEKRLMKMGVRTEFNAFVDAVEENSITYLRGEDRITEETNTVIWTAGIESSQVARDSGTALDAIQRGGRIETDGFLRAIGSEDVFVVGDNMYYVVEGEEAPVPQMVENAEHSSKTAAHNITTTIRGGNNFKEYKPSFHGVMVCIGGRYGAARVGLPNFMFNLPSFLAMFAKHFINIVYFVQVLGWNKIFSYIKHEFLTVRNRRSFVGGHLSNRSPSIMAFPIRLWLGAVWVFEGIYKVNEGWLNEYSLDKFFGFANDFYDAALGVIDGASEATTSAVQGLISLSTNAPDVISNATDAVSSGTGDAAGEAITQVLINWRVWDVFHVLFISSTTLKDAKLEQLAFKINIPLMNWFLEEIILANVDLAFLLQRGIVIIEILIGLALLAGLFTTLSAGVSIVLQLMFLTTTGWYMSTVWMFMASFAVLFAGSQSLALDYWVMPWLKDKWKKIPFVKKWYLYHD